MDVSINYFCPIEINWSLDEIVLRLGKFIDTEITLIINSLIFLSTVLLQSNQK